MFAFKWRFNSVDIKFNFLLCANLNVKRNINQIATARIAVAAKQKLIDFLRAGPANLMGIARSYFEYIRDLLKQLGEVIIMANQ